jgi:7-carboxy-7-deazaguanine synthase
MNLQPIERRVMDPSGTLDVHSIFYTFQGEGPFAGTPCVFVRLGGCNLQCPGCDTIYTDKPGDKYKRKLKTALETVGAVAQAFPYSPTQRDRKLVVITGGEPFRQNIAPFVKLLIEAGFFVQIESNGSFGAPRNQGITWNLDIGMRYGAYLVVSPKTGKVHPDSDRIACAYKYVMSHDSVDPIDGLPIYALAHDTGKRVARPSELFIGLIYLQPMDHTEHANHPIDASGRNRKSKEAVLASCLKHGYIVQPQIHKMFGVE